MSPWSACPKSEAIPFLSSSKCCTDGDDNAVICSSASKLLQLFDIQVGTSISVFFNIRLIPSDMPSFQNFFKFLLHDVYTVFMGGV